MRHRNMSVQKKKSFFKLTQDNIAAKNIHDTQTSKKLSGDSNRCLYDSTTVKVCEAPIKQNWNWIILWNIVTRGNHFEDSLNEKELKLQQLNYYQAHPSENNRLVTIMWTQVSVVKKVCVLVVIQENNQIMETFCVASFYQI